MEKVQEHHQAFDAPVLINLNDVCRLTSLSRTAINRWRSLGLFPSAVPLGDKRVAFVKAEVEAWVRDRIAERDRRRAAVEQEPDREAAGGFAAPIARKTGA